MVGSDKKDVTQVTSHNYSEEAEDHDQLVRIGGATRLAAKPVPGAVLKKEGRWSSDASLVYVRANMEDPLWASEWSGGRAVEYERQRGQGTR